MTQSEFAKWLESVLGDAPMEEMIAPEILEHLDRVQLQGEQAAWNFAKEDSRESFTIAIRAMCKTLFIVGYDSGREQAQVDSWFGEGSGMSDDEPPADDEPPTPRGLLPSS
jgi:hypothetical protein